MFCVFFWWVRVLRIHDSPGCPQKGCPEMRKSRERREDA